MEPRIFKVENDYSLEDGEIPEDFDYESQLTIRHQGSDIESEEISLKVSGIEGAQVVQLKPLEGGGGGADLVEYIIYRAECIYSAEPYVVGW